MPLSSNIFGSESNPAVPGGNIAKPLILALLALLAARKFGGGGASEEKPDISLPEPPETQQSSAPGSTPEESPATVSGGLGELVDQFRKSGLGDAIDSWITPGANKDIQTHEVSDAIGGDMVEELARRTGLSRDQVLDGLAKALPGAVDRLTPEGRVPSQQDLSRYMS